MVAGLGTKFDLRYTFDVAQPRCGQVELVLESPERFAVALNSQLLEYEDQSWRNLLGPPHQEGGDKLWTGPAEFENVLDWTNDYWCVPFGVENVRLVVRR